MRYQIRWVTSVESGELRISGWDVVDWHRRSGDMIVATYEDKATAVAIVKLLNTQEKLEKELTNVRRT